MDYLDNWIFVLMVLFYIACRFVLPALAIGYLLYRIGKWVWERFLWMRWFSL